MNSKEFWRLIEAARQQSGEDEDRQASLLVSTLVALGASAIIAFGAICKRYVNLVIDRADIGDTAFCNVIRGEHYLTTFAYLLVGRGETEYFQALASNDACDFEQVIFRGYDGIPLEYVVPTAYFRCTGQDHPEWLGFSEYLAAQNGLDSDDSNKLESAPRVTFDEPDLHDSGAPLHDLRENVASKCSRLGDDAFFLMRDIADLYYRLPTWKQTSKASALLVKLGNLTNALETFLRGDGFDLRHGLLETLVPDEPRRAPEETAAS